MTIALLYLVILRNMIEKKNNEWPWWHLHNNVGFALEQCVKGFNPICRYSNNSLRFIDHFQSQGHSAHSEVLITTCLYNAGFKISDFGGNGDFTPISFRNKHYVQKDGINNGTMRWRPVFFEKDMKLPNTLYHPVKFMI